MLNLFQHLTSLEDLFAINKILNSLKITDKSPYFLRFQNDTKIIFDFNSSPNEERICGRTTQLIANSDIPPQRGSGFADGRYNLLQVRIARKLSKLEPQVQLRNFTSVEQIQDRLGGVQPLWKTLLIGAINCTLQSIPPQRGRLGGVQPLEKTLLIGAINYTLQSIPPQRGRLGGVQHGGCKKPSRQTSSFNASMEVRLKNSSRQASRLNTSMEERLKIC